MAIGGSYGFSSCTNYNCMAIGGDCGFYSGTNYNCMAIGGDYGFYSCTNYNCMAIGNNKGFGSCTNYNCTETYTNAGSGRHASLDITGVGNLSFIDAFAISSRGRAHNQNNLTAATISPSFATPKTFAFTPNNYGRSLGVNVRFAAVASQGNITAKLQKYVNGEWVDQRSKTLSVADIVGGSFNFFKWDTGVGDDQLTTDANTWRFYIEADAQAVGSTIYGTDINPSLYGEYIPDDMSDIFGRRYYDAFMPGAVNQPHAVLDSDVYYQNAPSIRFDGPGEHYLQLPVKKGIETNVSYWVRHDGATSEPRLRISSPTGASVTTQELYQPANTWYQLNISTGAGAFDGLLNVYLVNPDLTAKAWFSDPVVV
jgi:hypothetical protein